MVSVMVGVMALGYVPVFVIVLLVGLVLFISLSGNRKFQVGEVEQPPSINIEQYVNRSEEKYTDIKENTEKKIIWANKSEQKTAIAIVYVHGFSASRQEVSPLIENLGKRLHANIFLTRLTGHGRSNEAMAEVSVSRLLTDVQEAYEIGKVIGEEVVLVGLSTGATLVSWLAINEDLKELKSIVLLSPNYGLLDKKANWLLLPGAKYWLPLLEGNTYQFTPDNSQQAKYWTHTYPTTSLIPMMQLVDFVNKQSIENIRVPTYMLYSETDTLVDIQQLKENFARIGAVTKKMESMQGAQGSQGHVLAGDILSPNTTELVEEKIIKFLEENKLIK